MIAIKFDISSTVINMDKNDKFRYLWKRLLPSSSIKLRQRQLGKKTVDKFMIKVELRRAHQLSGSRY